MFNLIRKKNRASVRMNSKQKQIKKLQNKFDCSFRSAQQVVFGK